MLHTMHTGNYVGSVQFGQVPVDGVYRLLLTMTFLTPQSVFIECSYRRKNSIINIIDSRGIYLSKWYSQATCEAKECSIRWCGIGTM